MCPRKIVKQLEHDFTPAKYIGYFFLRIEAIHSKLVSTLKIFESNTIIKMITPLVSLDFFWIFLHDKKSGIL